MFPNLGPMEMMVVLLVAVLLFGKRLPEVGRSLGKGIVEFKKGLSGIEDEFSSPSSTRPASKSAPLSSRGETPEPVANVPKFEAPPSASVPRSDYEPQPSGE